LTVHLPRDDVVDACFGRAVCVCGGFMPAISRTVAFSYLIGRGLRNQGKDVHRDLFGGQHAVMSIVERDATTIKTDTKETSNDLHEPATIWRNKRYPG
jgi:hypothetical protein